eukprot:gene25929-31740_t
MTGRNSCDLMTGPNARDLMTGPNSCDLMTGPNARNLMTGPNSCDPIASINYGAKWRLCPMVESLELALIGITPDPEVGNQLFFVSFNTGVTTLELVEDASVMAGFLSMSCTRDAPGGKPGAICVVSHGLFMDMLLKVHCRHFARPEGEKVAQTDEVAHVLLNTRPLWGWLKFCDFTSGPNSCDLMTGPNSCDLMTGPNACDLMTGPDSCDLMTGPNSCDLLTGPDSCDLMTGPNSCDLMTGPD